MQMQKSHRLLVLLTFLDFPAVYGKRIAVVKSKMQSLERASDVKGITTVNSHGLSKYSIVSSHKKASEPCILS